MHSSASLVSASCVPGSHPGYKRTKHLMAALEELTTQWRNSSHAASPLASPCLSPSNKYNPVQLPPGRFPKAAQMKEPLALPVQGQWGLGGPRGWLAQNRQEQSSAWERVGLQGGKESRVLMFAVFTSEAFWAYFQCSMQHEWQLHFLGCGELGTSHGPPRSPAFCVRVYCPFYNHYLFTHFWTTVTLQ